MKMMTILVASDYKNRAQTTREKTVATFVLVQGGGL